MIPTFILINQLHMVNTVWAVLIPGAFNVLEYDSCKNLLSVNSGRIKRSICN